MYGDDDYSKRDSRPLSFITSPLQESIEAGGSYFDSSRGGRRPLATNNGNASKKTPTSPVPVSSPRGNSFDTGPLSPSSLSLREHSAPDTASPKFPLSDMDYESNPNAIAQELNNLQALRRMSMDVGSTNDPDLPPFQGLSVVPPAAPTGDDNEDDPSRLFWVPARVHPELAPMEFKTFLENRVQSIKRRSGEQDSLSPDSIERSGSGSSLRRKKSMLSRQIDNDGGRGAVGYEDGAEQLERKKSQSSQGPDLKIADLQELDALVRDPSKAMRKLSLDTGRQSPGGDDASAEDMPILPQAPGIGLRRSTRTTYRKGSLRKGERVPFSKRAGSIRNTGPDADEPTTSSAADARSPVGYPLMKTQSDPTAPEEGFSRSNLPHRMQSLVQSPIPAGSEVSFSEIADRVLDHSPQLSPEERPEPQPGMLPRSHTFPRTDTPVPRIIETPPQSDEPSGSAAESNQSYHFPERSSSSQTSSSVVQQQTVPEPPARSSKRPTLDRQASSSIPRVSAPNKTLNDMAQHPAPLPGSSARTDALTFIPTFEDKKPEKKSKKDKDDSEGSSSRKPSWGWFKGSDEKEKKDKKKDDDHKDSKRGRRKASVEKVHDSARLDVLQSTMDTAVPRGRESLLLDRDNIDSKLQEERKKESSRKSGGEAKKEKDGIFSSFFGGSKKKGDRDSGGKKGSSLRTLSPDPAYRPLKPDVDYNWTRFSILEERAIYRMAHIKLANPRRALYSQVLLSNFMYSYLAKVQQMHPQMQIPQSALQKKQEAERRQREQEQQYIEEQQQQQLHLQQQQQQHQNSGEHYRYDYHQVSYYLIKTILNF
jgi:hypothetical protein